MPGHTAASSSAAVHQDSLVPCSKAAPACPFGPSSLWAGLCVCPREVSAVPCLQPGLAPVGGCSVLGLRECSPQFSGTCRLQQVLCPLNKNGKQARSPEALTCCHPPGRPSPSLTIQPLSRPFVQPPRPQSLSMFGIAGHNVTCLAKVEVVGIQLSSLIHKSSHLITEGNQATEA